MKALFFFPPNWCNSHPYLSIPCILPYIKGVVDVKTVDLNCLYNEYVQSDIFLDICLKKIETKVDEKLLKKYEMIREFLGKYRYKETVHCLEEFLKYDNYISAKMYKNELQLFREVAFGKYNGRNIDTIVTIEEMLGVIECQESNYYIQFYKEALDNYIDNTIDIVLISLAGTEQLVSTFTLCKCIKSKYPNVKIILGGNPFTKIKGKIDDSWIVFFEQLFDFLLLYEGEYSLRDLLLCLVNNQDVEAVPNCIYMKNNRIFKTKEDIRTVDIENSFIPDFSDYNLSCYDTPEVILPYYIERGCYWKKCTFCDHDFGYADCYRIKSIEKVIEDLKTYIDLYNVKYIHFVDEAIPPKFIEKMCYAFLENGIKISWFTCIKASKYFTNELCSLMEKAGCVFVSIGVESCCQSVLDNMKKGITVEEIEFTLENMKKNNIWAHSFMINNFEAETYADKWRSFSFVVNHKEIFPSIGIGNFTLSKNAKIFPLVDENRIGESVDAFSNDLPYETEESLDDDEYRALVKVYMEMNYTSYFFSKYLFEREHIAIFMSHLNKCQFLNSKCLEASVKRAIDYNARFILQNEDHDKLYIYTLLERKFYILPNMFRNVINEAKKYIESSENRVEDSNNSLLKFILDKLYV